MSEKNDIKISSEGNIAIVSFKAVSISNVEKIKAFAGQIGGFIEKNRPQRVVFDFEEVKFFSSQVLGMLLEIRAKLQAYGGEVIISAINPQLHRVFKITSLDRIFRFFPDKNCAVKAINGT
jgi:anti-sigma B factor antagonist